MQAVIFDFDGTIVDSLAGVLKLYEGVRGGRELTPSQRSALQNKSLLQIALEMNIPKWKIFYLAIRGRHMFYRHLRSVQVHPGMEEVIKELYNHKIPMYVLSSNRTVNVEKYLRWHELDRYFSGIHGGVNFLSKARAMFRLVKREKLDPERTWAIGDERIDVRSAHAAGLKVVAVTWGYSHRDRLSALRPEYLVDDAADLLSFIRKQLVE